MNLLRPRAQVREPNRAGARRGRATRLLATLGLLTSSAGLALAQGTLTPLLTSGPVSNRVNLVVLSEGYTSARLGQFLGDATNLVNHFLGTMPWQEYRDYVNAYAISVASAQSGSDHPTDPRWVDTYFNSVYEIYGFPSIITIPPNGYDANYANGQGKVDALIASLMPQADIVMLLVNDQIPGGSSGIGGTNGNSSRRPIISCSRQDAPWNDIPVHEAGHYFAGLVDEYEYTTAFPGYQPAEAPNSTKTTNRALLKWAMWIEPTTPVPTPDSSDYDGLVGLFEGAQYQTAGWYRPKRDCKMRTLSEVPVGFCEVCQEQILKSIYQVVRPIDGSSPAKSNVTVYSTQSVPFMVAIPKPQTHDLTTQWYTNNIAVEGATNVTFLLQPGQLGNGTHSVRAIVRDTTSLVRNDPTRLLCATNTWSATVSLNELRLTEPLYLSGGRFRLTVTGVAQQGFVIQASSNLTNWVKLTTNSLAEGKYDYTNGALDNTPFRYYRTVSPP